MRELKQYCQKFNKHSLRRTIFESSSLENLSFDSIIIKNLINFLDNLTFNSMAIYSPTKYEIDTVEIFIILKEGKLIFFIQELVQIYWNLAW